MRPPRILVVYKQSAYQAYFNEYRHPRLHRAYRAGDDNLAHFKHSHGVHNETLARVRRALDARGLRYAWRPRGGPRRGRFDWILSVGGDGTLLEAAHGVLDDTIVLGVNSDPNHSVGRFCASDARSFGKTLDALLAGRAPLKRVRRLRLRLDGRPLDGLVLNDVLVAHSNPAAMSHYVLSIGRVSEQQRSSGIWFATAAGSTGAVQSGGGRRLPLDSASYQYLPRELYAGELHAAARGPYKLKGGVLSSGRKVRLRSLMREGRVYVDGAHRSFPLKYGSVLEIESASRPLLLVHP
ncbi:MAG TPA: hypothetical protein VL404_01215 [Candidatus Eisenbacteria bacterium]|nr:hypothetical protein [Candidatus Eisenbacteria bacterium]